MRNEDNIIWWWLSGLLQWAVCWIASYFDWLHSVLWAAASACVPAAMACTRLCCYDGPVTLAHFPRSRSPVRCLLTYKCIYGGVLGYVSQCCVPIAMTPTVAASSSRPTTIIYSSRRHVLSLLGPSTFYTSGTSSWNILPAALSDPAVSLTDFRQKLETYVVWQLGVWSARTFVTI